MWEIIKKAARWVVSGFRWLGRKMGLISAAKGRREDKQESLYSLSVTKDISGIQNIILEYTAGEVNDSAGYTGSPLAFFGHQLSVHTLLQHIVRGEQLQAEKMIIANPNLLLLKGRVTDDADRTFNDITAFQAAIWPMDRHMWQMILKYLPKDEAANQLREHESESKMPEYVKKHGGNYNFLPLIQGLRSYVNCFRGQHINWREADQKWRQGVGGPQRKLPAHVVNEYCRKDRPFYPPPMFKENHLPRTRTFYNWLTNTVCSWFASALNAGLGFDFAINWGGVPQRLAWPGVYGVGGGSEAKIDLEVVSLLCEVRTEELAELKIQLLNPVQLWRYGRFLHVV